ncbi:hypothetical protein D3C83_263640 [compost metagenome]
MELKLFVTDDGEPPGVTIFFAAETEATIEIGDVIDQLVERITLVLQRGGDGKAVALLEEANHAPA